ncbi:aldehyde dehydrogenase family protein [Falsirhodobacter sp. 1013]|uniref:aldehyde dehydrogenase family protein n=1 Tax=Falsirhodobacter sp. 1013 TaxID=3417566 RepID=UPI003EB8C9F2
MLNVLNQLLTDHRPATACMFVEGRWIRDAADWHEVENPADEALIARTPAGGANVAEVALDAARRAQPAWAARPAVERGRAVAALADQVRQHADLLAHIVVAEQGKPLDQARGETGGTENFLRLSAEQARRIEGKILPSDAPDEEIQIRRLPHGVVLGPTAWNYPSALAGRKIGPALVARNSFILRAHDFTPLSGLAAFAETAGIPPGVLRSTATASTANGCKASIPDGAVRAWRGGR